MNTTLIYLLQVNVGIVLFYLFYRLFFAGDTFWKTRRAYLLLSIAASFIYPFLSIEGWLSQPEPMQTALVHVATLPEIVITPALPANHVPPISFWIIAFYLLVSAGFSVRFFVQLAHIARMRLIGKAALWQGQKIIVIEHETTPFSFFGTVFLNPASHTGAEIEQIMSHELTHVRQWHSVDVLIGEMLSIAFWFNPAVWLIKREIRQNLEFLADHQVLCSGFDTKNYQYHLLQLSYQSPVHKLGNQFNVSPLKKRIMMMNKQKTNKAAVLKYLLIVPLVLSLVLVANAQSVVKKTKKVVATTVQKPTKVMTAFQEDTVKATKTISQKDSIKMILERMAKSNPDAVITYDSANKVYKSSVQFNAPVIKSEQVIDPDGEKVFEVVEKMPVYPGGEKELINYLAKNIKYPDEAQKRGTQGTVLIRFVVNKVGKVERAEIIKTLRINEKEKNTDNSYKLLEQEGLRVVNAMQQWTPGEQKGKKVSVYYVLPINFKLDEDTKSKSTTKSGGTVDAIRESFPIQSKEKLYIVDGIPSTKEEVDALNPNKIKEINVLKDASATAIYGTRGMNGVVIITTKK